jgi:uncharacterized lipoprotein YmbA
MKPDEILLQKVVAVLLSAAPFFLVSILLGACTVLQKPGPPPRYFLLSPGGEAGAGAARTDEAAQADLKGRTEGNIPVIVGPVEIPAYLDRPQVVTLSGENTIKVSEMNRWAEPLDRAVERVVALDLQALGKGMFQVSPFSLNVSPEAGSRGWRVLLNIYAFEQRQAGRVVLDAWWCLVSLSTNQRVMERRLVISRPSTGQDMEETVKAMGTLLDRLSADIFEGLTRYL